MASVSHEERVLKRLHSLGEIFQNNLKAFKGIFLSLELLRVAVEHYFRDLDSLKAVNSICHADQHKRAAFTMLCIANTRPIQLQIGAEVNESLILINEYFALHAGLSHLKLNMADISSGYIKNLIYILRFRQPSPEILASTMYLLECACNGKKP
jgi:hypothetical protein